MNRRSNNAYYKPYLPKWIKYAILTVLFYIAICSIIYRFKHPLLTETELALKIPDAILWR